MQAAQNRAPRISSDVPGGKGKATLATRKKSEVQNLVTRGFGGDIGGGGDIGDGSDIGGGGDIVGGGDVRRW